jgi:Membrane protein involved in the export of O-antigen and teichoic acid
MKLAHELKRLGRHTAVYGLGGMVSRVLAVLLLPLYTHYLPEERVREGRDDHGADGGARDPAPARDLERVLPLLLRRAGDLAQAHRRPHVVLVHDGHGHARPRDRHDLRAADRAPARSRQPQREPRDRRRVGLWAQTNYQQLTALFRVEERSTAFAIASVTNVFLTILATILFVAVWQKGAIGLIVGNFTGTLLVYFALVAYRFEQLGLQFDRTLFRRMQKFGMPLVPLRSRCG